MKLRYIVYIALLAMFGYSCDSHHEEKITDGPSGKLLSFRFEKANNPDLEADLEMTVMDNGVVYGYMKHEMDLSSLTPSFEVEDGTMLYSNYVEESGSAAHNFSSRVTYTLKGENNAKRTIKVNLLPYTGLPVVVLNTESGKPLNEAIVNKEDWVPATIAIDGMGQFPDYQGGLSVRGRGNSTWRLPKKPFNIKLDSKDPILDMPKHKRWCFIAAWRDRTMMRNKVSFRIADMADNLAWTPRSQYVEVIFNGRHVGLYDLTEHVRVDANRVDIKELKATDIDEPKITGGYLLEFDNNWDGEPEILKFRSHIYKLPVTSKNPDEDIFRPEQKTWIGNYLKDIEEALKSGRYTDAAGLIDIPSFIDFWMVNAIVGNVEMGGGFDGNGPYSVFVHKQRSDKLYAGPVWDFDFSTFSTSDPLYNNRSNTHLNSWWYNELFSDPDFKAAAKARFLELEPTLRADIPQFIDDQAERISKSVELNWKMWPINPSLLAGAINGDEETVVYADAVERMKRIYIERVDLIKSIVTQW